MNATFPIGLAFWFLHQTAFVSLALPSPIPTPLPLVTPLVLPANPTLDPSPKRSAWALALSGGVKVVPLTGFVTAISASETRCCPDGFKDRKGKPI